ncbi:MAG: glycosyltransferase family 2 protein [Beijerinckiaceae bacterium]|nr:glycosyltransferase family 2 protein [Beijerinckiaceae bacterium]
MIPVLTIAIPTWNRAVYLERCLSRIHDEATIIDLGSIEILVCDNSSFDATSEILQQFVQIGLCLRIIRNSENIGSDRNIAQCFNEARGEYVLILGDDDLLCRGTLKWLVERTQERKYGVICYKSYGFKANADEEMPFESGRDIIFDNAGDFLAGIGSLSTLISACVVRKSILTGVDAISFVGGNLVQVHLVISAAIASSINLYSTKRRVACGRNYAVAYDFFDVFVRQFGLILDKYKGEGLGPFDVDRIERRMLISFFPIYLLRLRLNGVGDIFHVRRIFDDRFMGRMVFDYWIKPLLWLPRPSAILFGALTTFLGRLLNGDLDLGITQLVVKARQAIAD